MRPLSILAFIYAALSAYLFFSGFTITGGIYLLIGFLLFTLQNKQLSSRVFITCIAIHLFLLTIEVALAYRPCAGLLQEDVDYRTLAKEAAKTRAEEFDQRTVYEVVADLRLQSPKTFPASGPAHFAKPLENGKQSSKIVLDGIPTIPLGIAANSTYVYGNEGGKYRLYKTDEFGFRNPEGTWHNQVNIAALGDSFTNGSSIRPGETYVDIIRAKYPSTLNLSHGSNSPLHNLGAIREYLDEVKPKIVLWFHFENDIRDLQRDKSLDILTSYLRPDYRQGLRPKRDKIDAAIVAFLNEYYDVLKQSNPIEKASFERADRTDITQLARRLSQQHTISFAKGLYKRFTTSKSTAENYAAELLLFKQILELAVNEVRQWGGTLYFVYLPQCERYCRATGEPSLTSTFREYVLNSAAELSLPIIDIHEEAEKQSNPASLYFSCPGGHFNESGHRLTAEVVLQHLDKR